MSHGDLATAVALQRDGGIVVAGVTVSRGDDVFGLFRYHSDGRLDRSFGARGRVTTDFARGPERARAMAERPDGKIVLVGESWAGSPSRPRFAVARYRADGGLDPSFGTRGKLTTAVPVRLGPNRAVPPSSAATAVALQPDGKVVAAGSVWEYPNLPEFALARYLDMQPICVVPDVRRRPLGEARRAIARSHCSVGAVERAFSRTVKKGRVTSQRPRPKTRLPEAAKVGLVVSKGPRR